MACSYQSIVTLIWHIDVPWYDANRSPQTNETYCYYCFFNDRERDDNVFYAYSAVETGRIPLYLRLYGRVTLVNYKAEVLILTILSLNFTLCLSCNVYTIVLWTLYSIHNRYSMFDWLHIHQEALKIGISNEFFL